MKRIGFFFVLLLGVSCLGLGKEEIPGEQEILDDTIKPTHVEELPMYPMIARMSRIEGVVVIRAKLDGEGNVVSSAALSGARELIPACVANVQKWKFEPTPKNEVIIVYEFRFDGRCYPQFTCRQNQTFRPPNMLIMTTGFPEN